MVKSEDVKAKANEAIGEINRKAAKLRELTQMPRTNEQINEAYRLRGEIIDHLHVLEDIITELLQGEK